MGRESKNYEQESSCPLSSVNIEHRPRRGVSINEKYIGSFRLHKQPTRCIHSRGWESANCEFAVS
jgi:hypothetical protein